MPRPVRLKPVRLELNVSGRWLRVARFCAADEEASSEIMDKAEQLMQALNDPAAKCTAKVTGRIATDDPLDQLPDTLMTWRPSTGWRDPQSEPA